MAYHISLIVMACCIFIGDGLLYIFIGNGVSYILVGDGLLHLCSPWFNTYLYILYIYIYIYLVYLNNLLCPLLISLYSKAILINYMSTLNQF